MARVGRILVRRGAALVIALSMAVAPGATAAASGPVVLAAGSTASATILDPVLINPKPAGYTTDLIAHVTPNTATGTVSFYDDDGVTRTLLGSGALGADPFMLGVITASFTIPADQAAGVYHLVAVYEGDATFAGSESAPLETFTVGPRPSVTQVTLYGPHDGSGATAQQGDVEIATVTITDGGSYYPNPLPIEGSVAIRVDGVLKGTQPVGNQINVPTAGLSIGAHTVRAEFTSSNTVFADSAAEVGLTIVSNQVEATGYTPSPATFYPFVDRYLDTTAIRGIRYEPASVSVRISSAATGRLVRTLTVGTGNGAWRVNWNGRNTAGSLVAAGRYTIRQTVRDALGKTKNLAAVSVTVSLKRIVTHTVTLKQTLTQHDAGAASSGWVGWQFTLPSATVYKKLVFGVFGKSGTPYGLFGPHDYAYCPSGWNWYSCMAPFATFPASLGWKNVTGSVTRDRHGKTVRMYAVGGNHTAVGYARVVVTYGVLK